MYQFIEKPSQEMSSAIKFARRPNPRRNPQWLRPWTSPMDFDPHIRNPRR